MLPDIRSGVGQGCVLSLDVSSLHSEIIMRNISECDGISIAGHNTNNIRHADDTVLIADRMQKL